MLVLPTIAWPTMALRTLRTDAGSLGPRRLGQQHEQHRRFHRHQHKQHRRDQHSPLVLRHLDVAHIALVNRCSNRRPTGHSCRRRPRSPRSPTRPRSRTRPWRSQSGRRTRADGRAARSTATRAPGRQRISTPTMHQHAIGLPLEPIGPRVTPSRRRSSKRRMGSLDLVLRVSVHGRKSWIWCS